MIKYLCHMFILKFIDLLQLDLIEFTVNPNHFDSMSQANSTTDHALMVKFYL